MVGGGADCKMLSRSRLRGLFCCCTVCLVVALVFIYFISSTVISERAEYTESDTSGRDSGRLHSHRIDQASSCEIIDVAITVRGQSSCIQAALLIKSILLFRRNPIRLHFLVDDSTQYILHTLLSTWHLYGVEYNFYKIDFGTKDSRGIFLVVEVLPPSIERVINIECSVLLSADISKLWKVFNEMKKQGSVFGVVKHTQLRGIENSIMLIDLKNVRERKWSEIWKDVLSSSTREWLNKIENNKLEQTLFFHLNPGWNANHHNTSLNSPCHELQTVCAHSSVGSSDFKTLIQEYDGNLLRQKWIDCQTGPTFDQNAIDYHAKVSVYAPPCTDFKREGNQERRTHPFYTGQWYDPSTPSDDVTLLLHVTLDRLIVMLKPMCVHWEGPMSIAVFANDSEVSLLLDLIQSSSVISSRRNIAYHIVYKEGNFIYYPINPLRVVALQNSHTEYIFLNDMDFLPSFGLYHHLMDTVKQYDMSHSVLVISAFETFEDPKSFVFPKDKSEVTKMVLEDKVLQFHYKQYIRGHAPTDYPKWMEARNNYEIQWQPGYEPYLVASRNIAPLDNRFVSRNFNKVSHTEELYYQHYKFYVISDGFILHLPHSLSSDAKKQNENHRHSECYIRRSLEWRADMVEKYGNEPYLIHLYTLWNFMSSSYPTSI